MYEVEHEDVESLQDSAKKFDKKLLDALILRTNPYLSNYKTSFNPTHVWKNAHENEEEVEVKEKYIHEGKEFVVYVFEFGTGWSVAENFYETAREIRATAIGTVVKEKPIVHVQLELFS